MKAPTLELYYFDSCPYCQKVMRAINELHLKVDYKNIHSDINEMHKLMYITGRKTVPCLFIDGNPMHESDDIVHWLRDNAGNLEKSNS